MTVFRRALGREFADARLLEQALTHRSFGPPNNERLEFLGDAVLNHAIAEALFSALPTAPEGELTRLRAELVREQSLAAIARDVELGDDLRLGSGELRSGGFRRDSILADALEAVIGAVHLDGGWEASRDLIQRWFGTRLLETVQRRPAKDAKTRLQEWLQGRAMPLPVYELVETSGSDHAKVFLVRCRVGADGPVAEASGSSRRTAETLAAEGVLALLPETAR